MKKYPRQNVSLSKLCMYKNPILGVQNVDIYIFVHNQGITTHIYTKHFCVCYNVLCVPENLIYDNSTNGNTIETAEQSWSTEWKKNHKIK